MGVREKNKRQASRGKKREAQPRLRFSFVYTVFSLDKLAVVQRGIFAVFLQELVVAAHLFDVAFSM